MCFDSIVFSINHRLRQESGSTVSHNGTTDNSDVISGRVIGEKNEYFQNLKEPIELVFKHLVSHLSQDNVNKIFPAGRVRLRVGL